MTAPGRQPRVFRDPDLEWRFGRDGVVVLDPLPARAVAELGAIFSRYRHHHQGGFSATILSSDLDYRMAAHAEVARVLAAPLLALLRDYRAVACGFAVKAPVTEGGEMPLHQDISVSPRGARPGLSCWAPLVDVDASSGCLELVPGSQHLNQEPRAPGTPFPCPHLEAEIRARHLRPVPMRAGQVMVMHGALFHASEANRGRALRPVATALLAPADAPLVYFHRVPRRAGASLEAYEVAETFYLTHRLGERPEATRCLDVVPEAAQPISLTAVRGLSAVEDRPPGP